ncbi:putative F-box protein At1g23770 [Rosa rugosa]|uniref:putative F-box protein At1g23770 n=1 Tax=Rosa rugosa TaxID=74645 RepID=UPI002B41267E|nr:putative F-box protein At1g23770 [Rosa rugosa]
MGTSIAEGERWCCSAGLKSGTLKSVEIEILWNKHSVPFFLRRVLMEELGAQHFPCSNHQLLLETAVHAVLLDSGFVRFDSDSVSGVSGMSLSYTVPDILQNLGGSIQGIGLRFEKLDKSVRVNGSLTGEDSVYSVSLEVEKVASFIEFLWASKVDVNDIVSVGLLEKQETQVFNFWRTIKDEISLPLMIDLCAKAGLPSPPCLMSLPPELKTKILWSLSGVNIAAIECVCKELQKLGNDGELWKHRLGQQFPGELMKKKKKNDMQTTEWKMVFRERWRQRRRVREASSREYYKREEKRKRPLPFLSLDSEQEEYWKNSPQTGRRIGLGPRSAIGKLLESSNDEPF